MICLQAPCNILKPALDYSEPNPNGLRPEAKHEASIVETRPRWHSTRGLESTVLSSKADGGQCGKKVDVWIWSVQGLLRFWDVRAWDCVAVKLVCMPTFCIVGLCVLTAEFKPFPLSADVPLRFKHVNTWCLGKTLRPFLSRFSLSKLSDTWGQLSSSGPA